MKQERVCGFFISPKQGPKMESAVLNRVVFKNFFVLNRSQGLRPSAAPLHPNKCPLTPPSLKCRFCRIYSLLMVEAVCLFQVGGEDESFRKRLRQLVPVFHDHCYPNSLGPMMLYYQVWLPFRNWIVLHNLQATFLSTPPSTRNMLNASVGRASASVNPTELQNTDTTISDKTWKRQWVVWQACIQRISYRPNPITVTLLY